MSRLFASGGQSTGASASAPVYSFGEFQLFNAVLSTVVTMLYTGASDFICLVAESLCLFTSLSLFSILTTIYLFPVV